MRMCKSCRKSWVQTRTVHIDQLKDLDKIFSMPRIFKVQKSQDYNPKIQEHHNQLPMQNVMETHSYHFFFRFLKTYIVSTKFSIGRSPPVKEF